MTSYERMTKAAIIKRLRTCESSQGSASSKAGTMSRDSQVFFQATIDALPDHICVLDDNGRIMAVNRAWRDFALANQLAGDTASEGADYLAVCDAAVGGNTEGAREFASAIRSVMKKELDTFWLEYPCHSPTEQRWFLGRITRFPGPGPACVVITHENITQRRITEDSLRSSETRLRILFDTMVQGVMCYDASGNVILANPAAETILGMTLEEMRSGRPRDPRWKAINEDGSDFAEESAASRVAQRTARPVKDFVMGLTGPTTDGYRWLNVNAVPEFRAGDERPYQVLTTIEDITARRQSEEHIRFDASLLKHLHSTIVVIDEKDVITTWNQAAEIMYGWKATEAIGQQLKNMIHYDASPSAYAVGQRTLNEVDHFRFEDTHHRKDGMAFAVEVRGALFHSSVRGVDFLLFVIHDITEAKRSEEELIRSRETMRRVALQLQRTREEERRAVAREVHDEVGQMLTVLKLDVMDLIVAHTEHVADFPKKARSMLSHINSGFSMVHEIASHLRTPILDELGLVAAIQWQAEEFEKKTGVPCTTDLPDEETQFEEQEAAALFSVFQELLNNVARHAHASRVEVGLHRASDGIRLVLKDDGVGISTERWSDPQSMGLLGIRERLDILGGSVELTQRAGGGACVTVYISSKQ